MQNLEHLEPSQLSRFVKKLCVISSRYAKKHESMDNLDMRINSLKENAKRNLKHEKGISDMKNKIDKILESEKNILENQKTGKATVNEMQARLNRMQSMLQKAQEEKNQAIRERNKAIAERDKTQNKTKKQIHELKSSLISVKKRMDTLVKNQKNLRTKDLEKKIRKS